MKKTLLFAILALSINAFAQQRIPNSMTNIRGRMEFTGKKTSNTHSNMNFGRTIKHQMLHPGTLIQIFDSVYDWQWDTFSIKWKINDKDINIVYDAKNNLKSFIQQDWTGSAWVDSLQGTYTYDANNNQTNWLEKTWNGSAWVNSWQYTKTYDAGNNQTSELGQTWNGSAWVNSWQETYIYAANNNMTSSLGQSWNGSAWVNSSQDTYTYDANNNLKSDIEQSWNGSAWVNSWQATYTYDANNNLTSSLGQSWNGSAWVISDQDTYTYDANNNITSELGQWWDGSAWVNSWQYTYTYDANNFQKTMVDKGWNTDGTISSGDSSYAYFHSVSGINDLKLHTAGITVYPNPTTGKFTIIFPSTTRQIQILNSLGQVLQTKYTNNEKSMDFELMGDGIYLIQMQTDTQIITGKVIVSK